MAAAIYILTFFKIENAYKIYGRISRASSTNRRYFTAECHWIIKNTFCDSKRNKAVSKEVYKLWSAQEEI